MTLVYVNHAHRDRIPLLLVSPPAPHVLLAHGAVMALLHVAILEWPVLLDQTFVVLQAISLCPKTQSAPAVLQALFLLRVVYVLIVRRDIILQLLWRPTFLLA
jgi:hypothetical protein